MQGFAQVLADSIRTRIQSGQNIYDQAAAPLKPGQSGRRGYPDYKSARGLQPIRDWTWSGLTLRCLKVLTANENRAEPRVPARLFDAAIPSKNTNSSLYNPVWLFTKIPIVETAKSRWKQSAAMAAIFLSETSVCGGLLACRKGRSLLSLRPLKMRSAYESPELRPAFHGLFFRHHNRQQECKNEALSRQPPFVPGAFGVARNHRLAVECANQQRHDDFFQARLMASQHGCRHVVRQQVGPGELAVDVALQCFHFISSVLGAASGHL